MSRVCDFCDISENAKECIKMAEVNSKERKTKGAGSAHICLDCARLAVAVMEAQFNEPTVDQPKEKL